MFTNLLESKGKQTRSIGGSLVSLAAHAAIIIVAIQATLHAGQPIEAPPDKVVFAAEPPDKPVVAAPTPQHVYVTPTTDVLTLKEVVKVPEQLPDVDVTKHSSSDTDWLGRAIPDGRGTGPFDIAPAGNSIYLASQVDEPVVGAPGSPGPRYPEILKTAGVEGEVIATFVVDTTGRADPSSLVIVKETDGLFGAAVRNALPAMRFIPAKAGGRKVKQQVQQPFVFTIVK